MSWSRTYTHALVIAVDMLGSAILWSRKTADVTISAMCGLELRKTQYPGMVYSRRLVWLARVLNRIQAGHCEAAIASDMERLDVARALLVSVPRAPEKAP